MLQRQSLEICIKRLYYQFLAWAQQKFRVVQPFIKEILFLLGLTVSSFCLIGVLILFSGSSPSPTTKESDNQQPPPIEFVDKVRLMTNIMSYIDMNDIEKEYSNAQIDNIDREVFQLTVDMAIHNLEDITSPKFKQYLGPYRANLLDVPIKTWRKALHKLKKNSMTLPGIKTQKQVVYQSMIHLIECLKGTCTMEEMQSIHQSIDTQIKDRHDVSIIHEALTRYEQYIIGNDQ